MWKISYDARYDITLRYKIKQKWYVMIYDLKTMGMDISTRVIREKNQ